MKSTSRNRAEFQEISELIRRACVKKLTSHRRTDAGVIDEEYLFDIYCLDRSVENDPTSCASVELEGLGINAEGNIELLTEYDSDWSDLGSYSQQFYICIT